MISYNRILSLLPLPDYKDIRLMKNQNTNDIVRELSDSYKLYGDQGSYIYEQFYNPDPYKTAKNIHKFLKLNTEYEIEPENQQTSKSLTRYLNDGVGDCKHYSLAIASILKYMPEYDKLCFRFVSYDMFNPSVTHVYVVAKTKDGRTISIDPLQEFDYEKNYYFKKDKCFSTMALSRLSGTGRINTSFMKFQKKGSGCGCGSVGSCDCNGVGASFVKKILASPSRNAFLGLVRLGTFLNIGMKTKDLYQSNPEQLKTWWVDKFGGSWESLKKAIESIDAVSLSDRDASIEAYGGETRTDSRKDYCDAKYPWSLSPWSKRQKCYNHKIDGIGIAPVVAPVVAPAVAVPTGVALLTAGAPVLIALTSLIKQLTGQSTEWEGNPALTQSGGSATSEFNFQQYLPLIALGGVAYLIFKK